MKKRFSLFLLIALMLALAIVLSACGSPAYLAYDGEVSRMEKDPAGYCKYDHPRDIPEGNYIWRAAGEVAPEFQPIVDFRNGDYVLGPREHFPSGSSAVFGGYFTNENPIVRYNGQDGYLYGVKCTDPAG